LNTIEWQVGREINAGHAFRIAVATSWQLTAVLDLERFPQVFAACKHFQIIASRSPDHVAGSFAEAVQSLKSSLPDSTGSILMDHWQTCEAVERDPEKMSGAWVFRGTRVPVAALFENLRSGASVTDFLSWFPGVEPAQVEAVLDHEMATASGAAKR
jgi:uncharacterized protein (DUF433 family)